MVVKSKTIEHLSEEQRNAVRRFINKIRDRLTSEGALFTGHEAYWVSERVYDLVKTRPDTPLLADSRQSALVSRMVVEPIVDFAKRRSLVKPDCDIPALIVKIDTLLAALQENLDAVGSRINQPPSFDLGLNGNADLIDEVQKLTNALRELKAGLAGLKEEKPQSSLASVALNEFILKLSGALGDGMGKTVTWGTRIALAWFGINVLKELGVPVDSLVKTLQENLLPK